MSRPDKVTFLMYCADGGGGVARTVINLANELSRSRDVEIVSVTDMARGPRFAIDPAVRVTYLQTRRTKEPVGLASDDRRWKDRPTRSRRSRRLAARTTRLDQVSGSDSAAMTRWGDLLIRRRIRSMRSGILITTRPALHVAAARWARPGVLTIGQEHLNFHTRSREATLMDAQREALEGLDAFVALTSADSEDYARWAPQARARITHIPNGSSWPDTGEVAALEAPVAVAAGRIAPQKAFHRMVNAWAPLAREFPDWQLHIYGRGEHTDKIRQRIARLGVEDSVVLKGYSEDFDQVLLSSSLYLMTSRFEGFPMVLVEAMGKGLPLVAYDCPRGPADVIEDGVNGRLVPDGDRAAYTQALRELMSDADLRRRMGAEGVKRAGDYQMPRIAQRWVALFEELGRS